MTHPPSHRAMVQAMRDIAKEKRMVKDHFPVLLSYKLTKYYGYSLNPVKFIKFITIA